jgi:ribonucleoside-diphosphate reductase alpha chain
MEIEQPALPSLPRQIRKRDGVTLQSFTVDKIERAVTKAWRSTGKEANLVDVQEVTRLVIESLRGLEIVDIEIVQNSVEFSLMHVREFEVAKHYVLYRQKRAELRAARKQPDPKAVADYIHAAKYARYLPFAQRRELYAETVERVERMHLRKFAHVPGLDEIIRSSFEFVYRQDVLPSMRSMQFGGMAIEVNNNRMYNCCATHLDRIEAFSEGFFLLLSGCGVGYSVQFKHIDKLPELAHIDERRVVHHIVQDSIEGWADAARALLLAAVTGTHIEFAYHLVRLEGTELKTSGGKAPGHLALKRALEGVRAILLEAQGRRLRPVEAHRIMCLFADAVLSGGIRRSAMICLFSLEDSEMMYLKTGKWFEREPWLANANNSVVLKRGDVKQEQFARIFQMTKQFGEPGFVFVADNDEMRNPCAEISLNPKLIINYEVMKILKDRARRGKGMPSVQMGEVRTGWAFCNLCEINGSKLKTLDDFKRAAEAAATIGTLQAAYTDMPYLGWVSEVIAEREALLGIGMTGMMDAPDVTLNAAYQREVAGLVVEKNAEIAERIGIRVAARTTTVKPSGTTSLELGNVGSGHHPHHARRYIRRVVANELEKVFLFFKEHNPHMCVKKPDGDWVIEFPVEAPEGARIKSDFGATQFLDSVKSTQLNWVAAGTARPESSPGYVHNVSNTVPVRPEEWGEVAEYLWANRDAFAGVSFLPVDDKIYAYAPFEAVVTEADEARWNQLVAHYKPVDYHTLREEEDTTAVLQEPACVNGACENPNFEIGKGL